MKCERCGKSEAVMKITQLRSGEYSEMRVCENCAVEISPYQAKLAKKKGMTVDMLLKELLKQHASKESESGAAIPPEDVPPCPSCGLEYPRYKATFMLGCPDCYDSFGDAILEDIRRIHGTVEHVGKAPDVQSEVFDRQEKLRLYRAELQECIENEDFERAAHLRDEIKKMQTNMESLEPASDGGESS